MKVCNCTIPRVNPSACDNCQGSNLNNGWKWKMQEWLRQQKDNEAPSFCGFYMVNFDQAKKVFSEKGV